MERLCHPSCGADHLGVGGGAGQADQDVLTAFGTALQRGNGGAAQPVGGASQGDFPQGSQVFLGKEVIQGLAGLFLSVDFAFLQPFQQFSGLDVHQFHLVGGVEEGVRDPFGDGDPGDGGNYVVEAFQVLDIDGGVHVDAGPQKLLHILVPLYMAAALGVGVGKLIHQNQPGMSLERPIQVEFPQGDPLVREFPEGQLLQPL